MPLTPLVTPPRRAARGAPPRLTVGSAGHVVAPLAFLAVCFVWPTVAILWRGLAQTSWAHLPASRMADAVVTTLGLAAAGTAVSLAVGIPAAWALFRRSWPGQRALVAVLTVPFVLPTVVVAMAFKALLGASSGSVTDGRTTTVVAIIGALAFFNTSVVVRVVGPAWGALSEGTMHAARTLGASPWRAWREVRLPALLPALTAAAVTVWLFCTTSFGVVMVVGGGRVSTVDTEIWLQANQFLNLNAAAVLGLVQILMVSVTVAVASRIRARTAGHDAQAVAVPALRRGERWRVVAALTPAAVLCAVPLVTLVERSLRTPSGHGWGNYRAMVSGAPVAGGRSSVLDAALTSVTTALATGAVTTALAVLVALAVTSSPRLRWVHGAMLLPLGTSSVVVGLGMLLTLSRPIAGVQLARHGVLLPVAHMVVALPLALAVVVPAFRAVSPRLHAAAATLGASPRAVWRHVDWPLTRRTVAMAAGLAAAVSMGEFGASSFVVRPGMETLPTLVFRLLGRPGVENMGMAFACAVVLAALTAGLMVAADRSLSTVVSA